MRKEEKKGGWKEKWKWSGNEGGIREKEDGEGRVGRNPKGGSVEGGVWGRRMGGGSW